MAVACTQLNGRPVAVTGGAEHTVRIWDLTTATPIGSPLTGHTAPVSAVACTMIGDRPVAVTGSWDSTVRIWDLTKATPIGNPLTGHSSQVRAVACTMIDGRPIAVTSGGDQHIIGRGDCTVRIWDLTKATPIGNPLTGHTSQVDVVACAQLDGQPVAVTGSWDATVRIWDLQTRQQVDQINMPIDVYALDVAPSGEIVVSVGQDFVVLERSSDSTP
jgi:WD40 repeat protein